MTGLLKAEIPDDIITCLTACSPASFVPSSRARTSHNTWNTSR
ncbi:hypothetical protein [Sporisorium scitamineum]|uniref:Uncharacterized protein n=1 Tax=Sporisorium scitamineum TaxID=49012 RepID=A0A0F7S284_9BASI|nr:hypothetical protein [Sporisorium scitamineum]